jgi:hypothetical protein
LSGANALFDRATSLSVAAVKSIIAQAPVSKTLKKKPFVKK